MFWTFCARSVREAKEDEKRRKEEELFISIARYTLFMPHCRLATRISQALPAWVAGANSGPEREAYSSGFVVMMLCPLSLLSQASCDIFSLLAACSLVRAQL